MDWTDDAKRRLRALWDDGHSTAEIGRRLMCSKNAVVGKAHRLSLPARPSPLAVPVARQFVCDKGHPVTGDNLRTDGRYGRCKLCDNARRRARWRRSFLGRAATASASVSP